MSENDVSEDVPSKAYTQQVVILIDLGIVVNRKLKVSCI